MEFKVENGWKKLLESYTSQKSFTDVIDFAKQEYQYKSIFPPSDLIFNAFKQTSLETLKVVIVGQDPYHNPGQAHGLSFSVPKGVTPPPSLKNIYKEIQDDLGVTKDMTDGNLHSWAQQGVLLLNSVLSVEENKPGSHSNRGWEDFTDYVIERISQEKEHCVFILWGAYAQKKGKHINRDRHLVLESPHPSPLSAYRGFLGSKVFSKTNEYLSRHGKETIQW